MDEERVERENCLCQKSSRINEESEWSDVWEELEKLHNECPAIQFLVPDFKSWREKNKEPEPTAFHQSTLVLAFRRGHLDRITSPIHRYCLPKGKSLCRQYEKDLKETWFSYADSSERHEKYRIWKGRMAELKVAEWLEENGWEIEGMEAWDGKSDIKAKSPENRETLIEVKYIGQEDEEFKAIVESFTDESLTIAKGVCVTNPNSYVAFNYVLFRIFEAAHQLRKNKGKADIQKEVALVIDATTWDPIPLKWMRDSNRYHFFEEQVEQDINWCNFNCNTVKSQKNIKKYGDDLFNMHSVIKVLNKITVFKMTDWLLEQKKMSWTPPATLTP